MNKHTRVLVALLATAALPAFAEDPQIGMVDPMPGPAYFMRDSDGLVISILTLYDFGGETGGVLPGEIYYSVGGGDPQLPRGGSALDGQQVFLDGTELVNIGAQGGVVEIDGSSYRVETEGDRIWLRDVATGMRLATARHVAPMSPDRKGLSVNPAQFGLD